MAVPDFETLMLPLLRLTSDGNEHAFRDIIESLAREFQLTDSERNEMLPSGRQRKFNNRVGWAKTYLEKAGLLDKPRRGITRITDRGREVLAANPDRIDVEYLTRYPEFVDFRSGSRAENVSGTPEEPTGSQTPEEALESNYLSLREELAAKLLERVKSCSPEFFERLVVDLLVAMGYGGSQKDAGQAVGRSGDGGIDGIIKEDRLGLDVVHIQAKRWEDTVGRPVVQSFAGSLEGFRARKGVFITTSRFSEDAINYVNNIEKKIVLIDGKRLAQLMIDHGVGVTDDRTYVVKRLDSDYFEEE